MQAVSVVQPSWIHEVVNSYQTDQFAQDLLAQLAVTSPNADGFSLDNGVIRQDNKIWIGHNSTLQTKLIATFHASAIRGHSGSQVTYMKLKQVFTWKGLKMDLEKNSSSAQSVRRQSMASNILLGYYNHCLYLMELGRGCPWTSLRNCLCLIIAL
jgi:hypothetical protein